MGLFKLKLCFIFLIALVNTVDDTVKNVVHAFKENGLWKNTLLIFMSGQVNSPLICRIYLIYVLSMFANVFNSHECTKRCKAFKTLFFGVT